MAGVLCRSSPWTWTRHSKVVVQPATSGSSLAAIGLFAVENQPDAQNQLWEDLFSSPWEWWDNRQDKAGNSQRLQALRCCCVEGGLLTPTVLCLQRSPRHPDFRHKITRQPLWLNNQCKPTWVDSRLAILDAAQGTCRPGTSRPCDDAVQSFCEEGLLESALMALSSLDQKGLVPSVETYRSLLKACTKKKALAEARHVHAHLAKHQLESTGHLGDSVLKTLVKCGSVRDALQLFHRLPKRTVVSWTAVISGYADSGQGQDALRMYQGMRDEGLEPDKYTLVSLIRAGASLSDLVKGKQIHGEALKFRSAFDFLVGACLIDMYGKCGSVMDAQNVFDELSQHDVVSWNAMLAVYAEAGEAEKTLQLYYAMQQDGVSPNGRTFVTALRACRMLAENEAEVDVEGDPRNAKALEVGKAIHADAVWTGYDSDLFVGNTLVSMYGKCGSNVDAQNVFHRMSRRDVVTWTALLTAHGEQGQWQEALLVYEQMYEGGVIPNDRTFVVALQACGMLAEKEEGVVVDGEFGSTKVNALEHGKALHAEACRKGFHSDAFVASTLIRMYGTCRSVADAQNAFDRALHCDIACWSAMLVVCIEQGRGDKVLQLYEQMLLEGISPDSRTFIVVIQACSMLSEKEVFSDVGSHSRLKYLEQGKQIHAAVKRKGYDSDVFVGSALISLYGQCGSIVDALNVFNGLPHHDVVLWNSMVTTYVLQGEPEKALQLYEQMQKEGVKPNDRTFVSALQASGMLGEVVDEVAVDGQSRNIKSLERGRTIHADVRRYGYEENVFVANTLVSMYGKCGSLVDAQHVFDGLSHRNVVSWNAMLVACVEQCQAQRAMQLYKIFREEDLTSPDTRTFVSVLQACGMLAEKEDEHLVDGELSKVKSLEQGRAIHDEITRRRCDSDVFVSSSLISMYGKCGSIDNAKKVFDGLSKRSVVSWNAMLVAYVLNGQGEVALQLYKEMEQEGGSPDEITLLCILQACSNTGGLARLRQIHQVHVVMEDDLNPLVASALIHAYGKCASMADAQTVFDAVSQPDVVAWSALMAGYARCGDYDASLHCFDKMQLAGVKPNVVTFVSLLCACSHAGLVDRGVKYFDSMSREYGITPETEHYLSMLDLLGRAGCFQRMEELLSAMPRRPSVDIWLCVLGACQKHKQVALGKQAFDSAVHVAPTNAAAYMLMWNIYADCGLWDSAKEVTELRRKAGAWKEPGRTWLEYEQDVKSFVVGNCTQPAEDQLHGLLSILSEGIYKDVDEHMLQIHDRSEICG